MYNIIDDILFLWRGTEEELISFVSFLNSFHPTIKFKCQKGTNYDFDTKKVDFLDTTIWIDDSGFIQSTLYTKPCRVVQYLSPSSSHPSHITSNIPYSLAYRLRRIESTLELFETILDKLCGELVQRGYSKKAIGIAFSKVRSLDRVTTLAKVAKDPSERITLVIPFDKRLPDISKVLRHRWQCLIDRDPKAKLYMPEPPRVGYSKTQSLKDILVRSKVPPKIFRQNRRQAGLGFRKCGQRSDCSVCTHSSNSATHTCNHTGETFNITSHITRGDLLCHLW